MMRTNPSNDVQQCIQQCQQIAQQLRTLANQETVAHVKKILNEGAHHLDLCITECQFSLNELQAPTMV